MIFLNLTKNTNNRNRLKHSKKTSSSFTLIVFGRHRCMFESPFPCPTRADSFCTHCARRTSQFLHQVWNCDYEKIVDSFVQGCQSTPPTQPPAEHAVNFNAYVFNHNSTQPLLSSLRFSSDQDFQISIQQRSDVLSYSSRFSREMGI